MTKLIKSLLLTLSSDEVSVIWYYISKDSYYSGCFLAEYFHDCAHLIAMY